MSTENSSYGASHRTIDLYANLASMLKMAGVSSEISREAMRHEARELARAVWSATKKMEERKHPLLPLFEETGVLSRVREIYNNEMKKSHPDRQTLGRIKTNFLEGIAKNLSIDQYSQLAEDITLTPEQLVEASTLLKDKLGTNRRDFTISTLETIMARISVNGEKEHIKSAFAGEYAQGLCLPERYCRDAGFIFDRIRKANSLRPTLETIMGQISSFNKLLGGKLRLQGGNLHDFTEDVFVDAGEDKDGVAQTLKGSRLDQEIEAMGGFERLTEPQMLWDHIYQAVEESECALAIFQNKMFHPLMDRIEGEKYGVGSFGTTSFFKTVGFETPAYVRENKPSIPMKGEAQIIGKKGTFTERYVHLQNEMTAKRTREFWYKDEEASKIEEYEKLAEMKAKVRVDNNNKELGDTLCQKVFGTIDSEMKALEGYIKPLDLSIDSRTLVQRMQLEKVRIELEGKESRPQKEKLVEEKLIKKIEYVYSPPASKDAQPEVYVDVRLQVLIKKENVKNTDLDADRRAEKEGKERFMRQYKQEPERIEAIRSEIGLLGAGLPISRATLTIEYPLQSISNQYTLRGESQLPGQGNVLEKLLDENKPQPARPALNKPRNIETIGFLAPVYTDDKKRYSPQIDALNDDGLDAALPELKLEEDADELIMLEPALQIGPRDRITDDLVTIYNYLLSPKSTY